MKDTPDQTDPDNSFGTDVVLGRIEQGLTELKSRVDALEEALAERAGTNIVHVTADGGFDVDARVTELVNQGVSVMDAEEQARYEENLWNDKQRR